MKMLYFILLLGVFISSGCSTNKSLSKRERNAVHTLCVEFEHHGYIEYLKYGNSPIKIYEKELLDSALAQAKADLIKKGYQLVSDPNKADFRLVIRPGKIKMWETGTVFDGIGFSAYTGTLPVKTHVLLFLGLIDPKTGDLRAAQKASTSDTTPVEYTAESWAKFSDHEKTILISDLKRQLHAAIWVGINRLNL